VKHLQIPGLEQMDMTMDGAPVSTAHRTLYWCKIFVVPKRAKVHMVGVSVLMPVACFTLQMRQFDVITSPLTNKPFVHHFVIYKCPKEAAVHNGRSGPCFEQPGSKGGERLSRR
jgi:hypothetical protein